jgi:nucleotidyltransferase-like protein
MGGFEVIDHRYTHLFERVIAVLGSDDRVLSVDVGGSVGAGTADEWSDLDLQVVVREDAFDDFLNDWPTWLAEITPTVFARTPIARFVINTVTDDGLTLDFAVSKGKPFQYPSASEYVVGLLSTTRFERVADALEYAVAETLRGLAGPFITLVQREEHLRHLTGVPHFIGLLTTVLLAELDAPPLGKQWNRTLTPEQLATVEALPAVRATRDGVVDFGLGVAKLLVTRARPLFEVYELEWPAPLARIAARRLRDCLGIETSEWLY